MPCKYDWGGPLKKNIKNTISKLYMNRHYEYTAHIFKAFIIDDKQMICSHYTYVYCSSVLSKLHNWLNTHMAMKGGK